VVERVNKTVQKMACAMLDKFGTPATFWGEVAFATVTILNQANVRVNNTQTPHELWYGKTPTVKYFKVFGSKCYIKRTDEKLGKFEPRVDEVFSLVTLLEVKDINVVIKDMGKLLKVLMLWLMKHAKIQNK